MSVSKMKTLSIICKNNQLDDVLNACVRSKYFHPESTPELVNSVTGFSGVSEDNPYRQRLSQLLDLFEDFGIEPEMTDTDDETDIDADSLLTQLHDSLFSIQERKKQMESTVAADSDSLEKLRHFADLDVELDKVYACEFVSVRFGRLPADSYEKLSKFNSNPYMLFVPCSIENGYYWGMYVCPHDRKEEIDRIFASMFFERMHMKGFTGTPKSAIAELSEEIKTANAEIAVLDAKIAEYFIAEHDRCMKTYSYLKRHNDAFELRHYCARYKDYFMLLIGWVPEDRLESTVETIKSAGEVEISVGEPENMKRLTPPTRLKNKRLFRPFEMYVGMYGVPRYNEPDPTAFVAITYTILFGIMFADLGQGLLLSLIGLFMWKKMKMPIGKILFPCGFASAAFGTLFGSVFGFENALDWFYCGILGMKSKPIEVIDSAIALLVTAIGIGVVLLLLAMCLNVYSSVRRKDYSSAFFGPNGIAGIVLYSSLILLLLNAVLGFGIPGFVFPIVIVLCIALIFMKEPLGKIVKGEKDWKPESWGDYSLENGAELFEVLLSYFSNTISFIRVGAFVLIHAGMMLMFTELAKALGNPVAYVIIMIFGNIFVTALEALLVSIQTLRLEFYEMFSRFYNGDGREYQPISTEAAEI